MSRSRRPLRENPLLRRSTLALALLPAVAVTLSASSALADAPSTWANNPSVPALRAILVLLLIPAGLFALITLLVYIPSMSRNQTYQPGAPWRHEPEWFGGPRGGAEAIEADGSAAVTSGDGASAGDDGSAAGGSSGRW